MRIVSESIDVPLALLRIDLTLSALRLWVALRREVRVDKFRWPGDTRLLEALPPSTDVRTLRRAKSELLVTRCLEQLPDGAYVLLVPDVEHEARVGHRMLPTIGPTFEPFAALEPDPPKTDPLAGFDQFWRAYPRRIAKLAAANAWRLKGCAAHADAILVAVEAQAAPGGPLDVKANTRDGRVWVPHASTWLNGGRWQDEMAQAETRPPPRAAPAPTLPPEELEAGLAFGRTAVRELIQGLTPPPDARRRRGPALSAKALAAEAARLRALDAADADLAERKRRALKDLRGPAAEPETP